MASGSVLAAIKSYGQDILAQQGLGSQYDTGWT
jgi:hypothetical protein